MSGSNCCFLTCIHALQEESIALLKVFQFAMIHIGKGNTLVSEADDFLKFFCLFYDPVDVGNLISGFLNPDCTFGSSQFTYFWNLAWGILCITFLVCEMSSIVLELEHTLEMPDSGMRMNIMFPSPRVPLSFPNLQVYWVQHFNSIII